MADQVKSIFEELAPFARMIVVPGVTVGNLTYSNQMDMYSQGAFATSVLGEVPANTRVALFFSALNEAASSQGYASGNMGLGQTNAKFSKGQAPANQVFIATHAGFVLSKISALTLAVAGATESLLNEENATQSPLSDVFTIGQNFSWDLTIGRGITRTIGLLSEYGAPGSSAVTDSGVLAGAGLAQTGTSSFGQLAGPEAQYKKLEIPLVFPPLVNVTIECKNGGPMQLTQLPAGAINVQIRMVLKGYLMTMPVG